MTAFSYIALDNKGKTSKGFLDGDSERQVRNILRTRQLKPVEVIQAKEKSFAFFDFKKNRVSHISQFDLSLITRQLATLVQSNVPLVEALTATANQARKPRVKSLLLQVRARVLEGHSLAYGLGDFPKVFNEMYRAMVTAGERAGFLGSVLQQLADYIENRQYTQQKIKMAMIYPALLMLVAFAVVSLLMIFVIPEMVALFAHSKTELPGLTKMLIASSDFIRFYWWAILMLGFAFVVMCKQFLQAPGRRKQWHILLLKMPFISGMIKALESARFASTLSILVSSGVPLLEGLRIAGQVMSNLCLRDASGDVAALVQEGGSLHKALESAQVFPPMMVQMVASGEASGELETMLSRSALNQQRELEMTLTGLMSIFEPLVIVVMAVVVGLIVMGVLLPVFEMSSLVA